jgi:RNA polymerase sigma factor (sigma-70 family)
MTDREQLLDELRPVSFAIAYRMLGSVSEAEDVVQEALLRVHQSIEGGEEIASPRAFVATVTTRLAINELRSARARREHYVGDWLPEPIITDGHDEPAQHAEIADSLSLATLVLLESLSPEQRAVLLLHDVFDYDHAQIAEIIGKSEVNVRQLATRARRHVEERRPRFQTTREQQAALAARFFGVFSPFGGESGCSWHVHRSAPGRPDRPAAEPKPGSSGQMPSSRARFGQPWSAEGRRLTRGARLRYSSLGCPWSLGYLRNFCARSRRSRSGLLQGICRSAEPSVTPKRTEAPFGVFSPFGGESECERASALARSSAPRPT